MNKDCTTLNSEMKYTSSTQMPRSLGISIGSSADNLAICLEQVYCMETEI